MTEQQEYPYKATLKAGTGYDAPWVTVDGRSADDLAFRLKDLIRYDVFADVAVASTALRQALADVNTAQVLGGTQQAPPAVTSGVPERNVPWEPAKVDRYSREQPHQQQEYGQKLEHDWVGKGGHNPPAVPRPTCSHGPRDWKSFLAKSSGKLTEMWSCPLDRRGAIIPDGATKCDVQWSATIR